MSNDDSGWSFGVQTPDGKQVVSCEKPPSDLPTGELYDFHQELQLVVSEATEPVDTRVLFAIIQTQGELLSRVPPEVFDMDGETE